LYKNERGIQLESKAPSNLLITSLKQCGFLLAVSCFLGVVFHTSLIAQSFNGELSSRIQEKQLNDLKANAEKLSGDIRFIDLVSAKKLYDERQAIFLDARSEEEYQASSIQEALGVSLLSVVQQKVNIEEILPDKERSIVTFCSGGDCDVGVEMAKELMDRGYHNVFVLGEGYPGWEKVGYPVSKPEVKS
jgi:rhodanese-related sulfurtransferase